MDPYPTDDSSCPDDSDRSSDDDSGDIALRNVRERWKKKPTGNRRPHPLSAAGATLDLDSEASEAVAARKRSSRRRQVSVLDSDEEGSGDEDAEKKEEKKLVAAQSARRKKAPVSIRVETLDLPACKALLEDPLLDPLFKHFLLSAYRTVNRMGGMSVKYYFGTGRKEGREYADGGVQNIPSAGRRLILPNYIVQLDITNSVPFFLWWLCKELLVPDHVLAPLEQYVTRREGALHGVSALLGTDRDGAKHTFLCLVHGAQRVWSSKLRTSVKLSSRDLAPLRAFSQSITACVEALKPWFPRLWAWCEKRWTRKSECGSKFYSPVGAFVHYVSTRYEAEVMGHAEEFLAARGCANLTRIHDACLVEDKQGVLRSDEAEPALQAYIGQQKLSGPESVPKGYRRADFALLSAPSTVSFTREYMVAREGDLQAVRCRELITGTPSDQTGFTNTRVYNAASDMVEYTTREGEVRYGLHPVSFGSSRKVVMINALMGLGKSVVSRNAILDLLAQDRTARILLITGRNTQAVCANSELAAKLEEAGFPRDIIRLYDEKREDSLHLHEEQILIIQFESLWRLFYYCKTVAANRLPTYDMLVLDEFALITDQRCSPETNKLRMRANDSVFMELCRSTQRVLVMDKDLNSSSVCRDFFLDGQPPIATQETCEFHDYRYVPERLRRTLRVVDSHDKFFKMLIGRVARRENTIMPFRSQRALCEFYDMCTDYNPYWAPLRAGRADRKKEIQDENLAKARAAETKEQAVARRAEEKAEADRIEAMGPEERKAWDDVHKQRIYFVTGETQKSATREMFLGPPVAQGDRAAKGSGFDRWWQSSGCVALLFTCALSVAADLTETKVESAMLHCASGKNFARGGAVARTLWQMIYRARNVVDQSVYCYFGQDLGVNPSRMRTMRRIGAETINDGVRPWQHGKVYRYMERNYRQKKSMCKGVMAGLQMGDAQFRTVTDPVSNKPYRVLVETSLMTCILAKKTEIELNRSFLLLDQLTLGHAICEDQPVGQDLQDEMLQKMREPGDQPEAKTEGTDEKEPEYDATESTVRRLESVLSQFDFETMSAEDASKRLTLLRQLQRTIKPSAMHKVEESVLEVLENYPGFWDELRRTKPSEEKDWPDIPTVRKTFSQLERTNETLYRMHYALSDMEVSKHADSESLYHVTKRVPIYTMAKFALPISGAIKRVAGLFGYESAEAFLQDTEKKYTIEDIEPHRAAIAGALRTVVLAGTPAPSITHCAPPGRAVLCLNALLSRFGYVFRRSQSIRKQVAGKRKMVSGYSIGPDAGVHAAKFMHRLFYQHGRQTVKPAFEIMMQASRASSETAKKKNEASESSRSTKKRRLGLVTADADVG